MTLPSLLRPLLLPSQSPPSLGLDLASYLEVNSCPITALRLLSDWIRGTLLSWGNLSLRGWATLSVCLKAPGALTPSCLCDHHHRWDCFLPSESSQLRERQRERDREHVPLKPQCDLVQKPRSSLTNDTCMSVWSVRRRASALLTPVKNLLQRHRPQEIGISECLSSSLLGACGMLTQDQKTPEPPFQGGSAGRKSSDTPASKQDMRERAIF